MDFLNTLSISAFLDEVNATQLEVIDNRDDGGSIFFATDSAVKGKVTLKTDDYQNTPLQVARCKSEEDGEFWMLCKKDTSRTLATFTK